MHGDAGLAQVPEGRSDIHPLAWTPTGESGILHQNVWRTNMLEDLATHFEAASQSYATAHSITRDSEWFLLKLQEEVGELTQAFNRKTGRARRKGLSDDELARALADETADVIGHVLLFARAHDVDLAAAIERKWRFKPEGV
jgi:NTP pyrophosphatase (non-canonical NTP hydrolase)